VIAIEGESSALSLTVAGSSIQAAFGAELATGAGVPLFEVTQRPVPLALEAVQPAGSVGAATASKLSGSSVAGGPTTAIDAEELAVPEFELVNDAVLESDAPQLSEVVLLTTWA
jgi:hypothetical protein